MHDIVVGNKILKEILAELKYANKLTKAMAPKTAHVTKD